ncbi:hypothetical protein B566_EDAN002880 [Ephemera danica]|nr:hypothetical protein B566_EDAN002880 [Ephemera danica]
MGASLTLPSSLTLANVMEKWATKAGFPVISVTRNYVTEKVILEQFLFPPHTPKGTPITWNVPIFWTTEKEPNKAPLHWLLPTVPDTNQINLPSVTKEQWLLVNKDQAGFYRVNYDQKNWQLLSKSFLKLTTSSRAMLLDDALNLARGGRLDYVTALDVTELLPNETKFAPWSAALNGFSFLYDRLSNEAESREVIEKYILEKLTYIYVSIDGFEIKVGETHDRLLMKQLILHWACRVGHKACIQKAVDLFNSLTPSTNTIKPDVRRVSIKSDVRRVSYCTGIKKGRNVDFNLLKARYTTSTNPDNPRIVYGLGCSTDTDTLRKYLEDSVTIPTIPTQINIIGRQVFTAVCQNPIGIQLALDFLTHQWHQASNV